MQRHTIKTRIRHRNVFQHSDRDDDDITGLLGNLRLTDGESGHLEPPVTTPGRWVDRKDFRGKKSFGYYKCDCQKWWISAHAFKNYKQGCKGCEKYSYPDKMWENLAKRDPGIDNAKRLEGPHDKQRCMACKAGVCTAGN